MGKCLNGKWCLTAIVGRVPFAIKGKSYFSFILQVPTKDWTKRDFFNEPCEHGEVKNPTSPYMHLKKPGRFCGADVFETSVLAHEVELAAADCLQSAYVLSKATKLVQSTMLTGGTQRVRLRTK